MLLKRRKRRKKKTTFSSNHACTLIIEHRAVTCAKYSKGRATEVSDVVSSLSRIISY